MAYQGEGAGAKRSKLEEDQAPRSQSLLQHQWDGMERDFGGRRKREESERVNHILLFTILNPMYPITTDVLHTICSTHGQVLRIVVFKKHGVQAMVISKSFPQNWKNLFTLIPFGVQVEFERYDHQFEPHG